MKILNNLKEIKLKDIENNKLTISQLLEIYNEFGFIFIGNEGNFTKIRKEN